MWLLAIVLICAWIVTRSLSSAVLITALTGLARKLLRDGHLETMAPCDVEKSRKYLHCVERCEHKGIPRSNCDIHCTKKLGKIPDICK